MNGGDAFPIRPLPHSNQAPYVGSDKLWHDLDVLKPWDKAPRIGSDSVQPRRTKAVGSPGSHIDIGHRLLPRG